ncbi:HERV-H LTR-associating protein 1 [Neosynchiropus ocellatus]
MASVRKVCRVLALLAVVLLSPASSSPANWTGTGNPLDSEELPAEFIDPAAIDLTPLVNTLINSSQSGSRQLFSLLSVTSYSSVALHKLTLLVYNISSLRTLERDVFRRRFCYCVSNDTNDLTDFTAVLLDVMGNSSSHLQEIFKSASILSVSQRNNSECIYICVMAGRAGHLQQLWDVGSVTPLFNQTVIEGRPSGQRLNMSHMTWSGSSRVHSTVPVSPMTEEEPGPTLRTKTRTSTGLMVQTLTAAVRPPNTTSDQRTGSYPGFTDPSAPSTLRSTPTPGSTHWTSPSALLPAESTVTPGTVPPQVSTASRDAPPFSPTHVTLLGTVTPELLQVQSTSTQVLPHSTQLKTFTSTGPSAEWVPQEPQATVSEPAASSQWTRTTYSRSTLTAAREPLLSLKTPERSSSPPAQMATDASHPTKLTSAEVSTLGSVRPHHMARPASEVTEAPVEIGCGWKRAKLSEVSDAVGYNLQPCVLELCRFFAQCLCRRLDSKAAKSRYCDDSDFWYEKHALEVCRRVRRVSVSRNLKQRCLLKMCDKL